MRAVVVLAALRAIAYAGHTLGSGGALDVGAARATLVVDAILASGTLRAAGAVARDRLAGTVAALQPRAAIIVVTALLALAGNAEFLVFAVFVRVASRVFGLATQGEKGQRRKNENIRRTASSVLHGVWAASRAVPSSSQPPPVDSAVVRSTEEAEPIP